MAALPEVPPSHPLWHEWRQRRDSAARLITYLRGQPRPFSVLEVGCGNGWLANQIAQISGIRVTGLDVNEVELRQARRVFVRPDLAFVLGDVLTQQRPDELPDVIVAASVIQYVPDLSLLIVRLLSWLAPGGELEILDSPLYTAADVVGARERTRQHYAALGVPEMADAYHHHEWRDLDGFDTEVRYRPVLLQHRLERRLLGHARSPFPWIRIRPERGR